MVQPDLRDFFRFNIPLTSDPHRLIIYIIMCVSRCRQEFTAYAQKALDRLTRSIVQTSSAIQSSKWLAGAKVIYDAVRTRRAAQGLETKPFMEWAGLEHEVDRLVAGSLACVDDVSRRIRGAARRRTPHGSGAKAATRGAVCMAAVRCDTALGSGVKKNL